jgi:hypothetical protein
MFIKHYVTIMYKRLNITLLLKINIFDWINFRY